MAHWKCIRNRKWGVSFNHPTSSVLQPSVPESYRDTHYSIGHFPLCITCSIALDFGDGAGGFSVVPLSSQLFIMTTDALEYATLALGAATPSISILQSALRTCQVSLQDAQNEVRQLKLEIETLKTASPSSSGSSLRRDLLSWLKSEVLMPHAKVLTSFAKKFIALEELWPNENAFLKACPSSPLSIKERYESPEAYILHTTYLLYTYAPVTFRGYLENLPAFKHGVLHQQTDMRSHMAASGRRESPVLFKGFGIPDSCWDNASKRLDEPLCLKFISRNPTNKPVKYDLYPPVLYGDIKNKKAMFMQPALIRIARLVFFGPGSLKPGNKIAPHSLGMKWGPLKTTPGLMALSCTLAIFLLSGDKAFKATGRITGIPYSTHFHDRKQLLEEERDTPAMQDVFHYWDEHIFAGVPRSIHDPKPKSNQPSATLADEQEEARQALLANPPENDSEEGEVFNFNNTDDFEDNEPEYGLGNFSNMSSASHGPQIQTTIPILPPAMHTNISTHITSSTTSSTIPAYQLSRRSRISSGISAVMAAPPQISTSQLKTNMNLELLELTPDIAGMTLEEEEVPLEPTISSQGGRGGKGGNGKRGRGAAREKTAAAAGRAVTRSQK
ncbi:hypothetical protein BDZ94DRAFT_1315846 [Collybia nuda]|uniref:Uncharacterized protein n=1 Tax=Collybia nuda TaxID=64659 RepID=A0A9P5XRY4_9AGAR|nr:hypothetical protein BDZ94DRAFT_1315844 [Collybia nuda]KAF9455776.1 hypothetical protein BDZ94DRAFT_1315846 [Collybia nuda]